MVTLQSSMQPVSSHYIDVVLLSPSSWYSETCWYPLRALSPVTVSDLTILSFWHIYLHLCQLNLVLSSISLDENAVEMAIGNGKERS